MKRNGDQLSELQQLERELLELCLRLCRQLGLRCFAVQGTLLGAVRHGGFIPWDDDVDLALPRDDYERFLRQAPPLLPKGVFLQTRRSDPGYPMPYAKLRRGGTTFLERSVRQRKMHHGVYIDLFPLDNYPDSAVSAAWLETKKMLLRLRLRELFDTSGQDGAAKRVLARLGCAATRLLWPRVADAMEARERLYRSAKPGRRLVSHGSPWGRREIVERAWFESAVPLPFDGLSVPAPAGYDAYLRKLYGDYGTPPPEAERVSHHDALVVDLQRSYTSYTEGKRVLFVTRAPAPYRIAFFRLLGQSEGLSLTAAFLDDESTQTHRDRRWFSEACEGFTPLFLGGGRAAGRALLRLLREPFDEVILGGYADARLACAIEWLKLHGRPYALEADGGLIRRDRPLRALLKRQLIGGAARYYSSGRVTDGYFLHYGALPERIRRYPFSSVYERELCGKIPDAAEKRALRRALGFERELLVFAAGQMVPGKGFDLLLRAAQQLPRTIDFCIAGGAPDEALRREAEGLDNVRFPGFLSREEMMAYCDAADVFVLPTRGDSWGLVVNEAMARGLPVITTDRCVAGLELVRDGENGFLVPAEDAGALAEAIGRLLRADRAAMGRRSREIISGYTLEAMARRHRELLLGEEGGDV